MTTPISWTRPQGRLLTCRDAEPTDAARIDELCRIALDQGKVDRFFFYPDERPPITPNAISEWASRDDGVYFTVVELEDGRVVGVSAYTPRPSANPEDYDYTVQSGGGAFDRDLSPQDHFSARTSLRRIYNQDMLWNAGWRFIKAYGPMALFIANMRQSHGDAVADALAASINMGKIPHLFQNRPKYDAFVSPTDAQIEIVGRDGDTGEVNLLSFVMRVHSDGRKPYDWLGIEPPEDAPWLSSTSNTPLPSA